MFEDIRPINTYSFHELKSDYSYFKDEDYGNTGYSSELYTMVFYYTKAYDNFDRSYMKIQDLAAIVGGFLKIILLAGSLICELVCTFIREEVLYNELFRFKRKNISNLKIKK
jgi:hypothetical protein